MAEGDEEDDVGDPGEFEEPEELAEPEEPEESEEPEEPEDSPEPDDSMDTATFAALDEAVNAGSAADAPAAADGAEGQAAAGAEQAAEEAPKKKGPGALVRGIKWFLRWHPVLFLALSAVLAGVAWYVYPEPESRKVPPAESFYNDGLDRLLRIINPDLPLLAASPSEEALAARNAFLNLFVFHRENLGDYPHFINPHLLLAESNRILALANPAMANQYWQDAVNSYYDAALWENRADTPEKLAAYYDANFLGGAASRRGTPLDALDPDNDEVVLRRARRADYLDFHGAEGQVNLGRPELARGFLENLRRREDARQREELRLSAARDMPENDVPRRTFELGPDDYRQLDLLLARTFDGLSQLAEARGWYLRYLASTPGGRDHAFVVERLADIAMGDGEVYRRVNPAQAAAHYTEAAGYYRDLLDSPSATPYQTDNAVLGIARANSRLAGLVPESGVTGVDGLSAVGRTLRTWLEEFSGQPLPRRTLGIPTAVGEALAKPELILPGAFTLPGAVGGTLAAMSGGRMSTPREERRVYLQAALDNYDRVAESRDGTPAADRARVQAAWAAWDLGDKTGTEARLERMLDPLSSPEVILAARLGLAVVALDRGDLGRAHMLVLGGHAHPAPLWFEPADADFRKIAVTLGTQRNRAGPGVWRRVWTALSDEGREIAGYAASGRRLDDEYVGRFLRALNTLLRRDDLYTPEDFPPQNRNLYLAAVLARDPELLTPEEIVWRNRLLLEEAWPYDLAQRASRGNISFDPFPPAREILPDALVEPERIRDVLVQLARAWSAAAAATEDLPDRYRMLREGNTAYNAALDRYGADPGELLYELATNYESLADIRERQGRHLDALSLTATAARSYMDVSIRSRGAPREMDALLAAGDAFFRSGLLERTVESQQRFLERFGHNAQPGTDGAMSVVVAENLLGRAYWFLSSPDEALASFRRNIPRRTPDRYKSMYYIGRVLLEEGEARGAPEFLGDDAKPLPDLDRNGDPVIETALQAFNHVRQSPGINPSARAWRWSTFDLARLRHLFAERARKEWEAAEAAAAANADAPGADGEAETAKPWLPLYDIARARLTEALERYPLRRAGTGGAGAAAAAAGISVRVEPEDYADTMAARFEAEYLLANTLLVLARNREDEELHALSRAHLENLRDRGRYANALFDATLDRFQLNAAVIREEVDGGNWDRSVPLPRTRLGDDEGPTHSPRMLTGMLRNSMMLLGEEYFRAGEATRERQLRAGAAGEAATVRAPGGAEGFYQDAYRTWQDFYDRFGLADGPQAMVRMGDCLSRLGFAADAGNHYRMAVNMAEQLPPDTRADGLLDIGPAFWGEIAAQRIRDAGDGYALP